MMIIGADYYPSFQQIAFLVEESGEYGEQDKVMLMENRSDSIWT